MIGIIDLGLDFGAGVWMGVTSNRALARQLGVSETAVRRAEKASRIKRDPDGSWDPAKVQAAWSDNTDQVRRALKPVPEAAVGAVRDTLREHARGRASSGEPAHVRDGDQDGRSST
jgi:hypothetical protein